jgi:hypothetical protein
MQFNEELLPLEAQLTDLGPRKCVYLNHILKDKNAKVCHGQLEVHSFVVLKDKQTHN